MAFRRQCRGTIEAEMAAGSVRGFDPDVLTLSIVGVCGAIPNWYEAWGCGDVKEIYRGLAIPVSSQNFPRTGRPLGPTSPGQDRLEASSGQPARQARPPTPAIGGCLPLISGG